VLCVRRRECQPAPPPFALLAQAMRERASTCLESGRRHLLRAPTPGRRPLPALCAHFQSGYHGSTLSTREGTSPHDINSRPVSQPNSVPLPTHSPRPAATRLDFLYPEASWAWPTRPYQRGRHFSTAIAAAVADYGEASTDEAILRQTQDEMAVLLSQSTPLKELQRLIDVRPPGKQELAWLLYQAIPPEERASCHHRLLKNLLEYLAQDGSPLPSRALDVFNAIPPQKRRPSSFRIAIEAYTSLRLVGPAIQLLEIIDSRRGHNMLDMGIDRILERTVIYHQWDLSIRVFKTFLKTTPDLRGAGPVRRQICHGDICPELWRRVIALPELLESVEMFLQYVREFKDEIKASRGKLDTLRHFTMTFIPNVMGCVLNAETPNEDFIWNWFTKLFDDLHATEILPTTACYEYAIGHMLSLPRYQPYTNKRKIWLELYRRYRDSYLKSASLSKEVQKPSQKLIGKLIGYHTRHGGLKRVMDHVRDLRSFYPGQPLPAKLLIHLIHTFAAHGEHARVDFYLKELQANYPDHMSLNVVSALLHVYARRADVPQTFSHFKRIREEFGYAPDVACWNILLLAYVRADDLDGALECFNACVDSGVQPDVYTFGPLLDFAAHRGDIEAFETLFSRAKQVGVDLDSDVRARSGYVECFLNAGDPEGATAIAKGMLQNWQAGTLQGHPLTHTWNLLIQHYALAGDLPRARGYYREMVENGIPLDSWSYGGLMRALIEAKQTNAAYKVLRVTMPQHNRRVHGLHYAIVMSGFLRERQFDLAMDAQRRMVERQVPQTPTANKASLEVLGARDLYDLNKRRAKHPNFRLLRVEEALQEMLISSAVRAGAYNEPESGRYIDSHNMGAIPQSYYGSLISLYTKRSAFSICRKLIRQAEEAAPEMDNYSTPTTLTAAIMESLYKAGKYTEIDPIWELALASARKLTKTFGQLADGDEIDSNFYSLFDPRVQQLYAESRIANNRRQILVKACRIYLRSLFARSDAKAIMKATVTIRHLLVNGYAVDNFTWNEYIQQLVLQGFVAGAFRACEQYLMPRFPGWRNLSPNYVRHDIRGYQWMELRHHDITRSSVLPRYKTLVLLAKALHQVKADEKSGIGYDEETGKWMSQVLDETAPLTSRAIETMPVTEDELQKKHLAQ